MFCSKKRALVKRLLKKKISRTTGIVGDEEPRRPLEVTTEATDAVSAKLEALAHQMLNKLNSRELQSLVSAIDSKGGQVSDCVLVSSDAISVRTDACARSASNRASVLAIAPHLLFCQMWRWPHLKHSADMKPLAWCRTTADSIQVCINPYHWSQICKTDIFPPAYSSIFGDPLPPSVVINRNNCQEEISSHMSTETGGSVQCGFHSHLTGVHDSMIAKNRNYRGPQWCTLAYWELRNRVGRLFPVFSDGIDVFADLPHGDGLWLEPLFSLSNSNSDESVRRTRDKIGFGVSISRDKNSVWVYNRSNHAIFVNSPTLDPPNTRNLTVFKVLPGFSISVFDFERAKSYVKVQTNEPPDGPNDLNAFRISFTKGWGPEYSRQFITSCPCWLEVLLSTSVT